MPSNLKFTDIKELRILPRNQCFYAEFVYEKKSAPKLDLNLEFEWSRKHHAKSRDTIRFKPSQGL